MGWSVARCPPSGRTCCRAPDSTACPGRRSPCAPAEQSRAAAPFVSVSVLQGQRRLSLSALLHWNMHNLSAVIAASCDRAGKTVRWHSAGQGQWHKFHATCTVYLLTGLLAVPLAPGAACTAAARRACTSPSLGRAPPSSTSTSASRLPAPACVAPIHHGAYVEVSVVPAWNA